MAKIRLATLGYYLLEIEDYCVVFSNDTDWSIILEAEPYEDTFQIRIRYKNRLVDKKFYVWMLMEVFQALYGFENNDQSYEGQLDYIAKHKSHIFEIPPSYIKKYDEMNPIIYNIEKRGHHTN